MKIRDRIKELRRVKASDLQPNPKNWRTHPQAQMDAIRSILGEVGFAGAELARELPDGSLQLIDGHARAEVAGDAEVPVLILDVTEQEADKLLATFDPIGAMAGANAIKLEELALKTEFDSASIRRMLDDLIEGLPDFEAQEPGSALAREHLGDIDREKMELQPEEHYDYILILADSVGDWNRLVKLFELPHVKLSRPHRRIGMSRAVRAAKVLELIDDAQK
jgi:ParB-like chromosome segregation protein Spo0J